MASQSKGALPGNILAVHAMFLLGGWICVASDIRFIYGLTAICGLAVATTSVSLVALSIAARATLSKSALPIALAAATLGLGSVYLWSRSLLTLVLGMLAVAGVAALPTAWLAIRFFSVPDGTQTEPEDAGAAPDSSSHFGDPGSDRH